MKLSHLVVSATLAALMVSQPIHAGGNSSNHMAQTLNQQEFDTLADYAENAKRLSKEDKAKGKTLESLLAEDRAAVTTLVKSLPLNCEVTSAIRAAAGPDIVDGKKVDTVTYEASCSNGMGYFLVTQEPEKPYGFSCFSVDATRQADIKAGRKPTAVCGLPASADMKKFAVNILAKAGKSCALKEYRYIGQNSASHTEFVEYACEDGKGYISVAGLPGADIPIHVETCSESATRGLPCKLSDNATPAISLKTFRDAVAEKKIACTADDGTTRLIGRETARKRYVVEFQCREQPGGLVAFIPLSDSTAPFESLDCAAAFKHGAICALPGNR